MATTETIIWTALPYARTATTLKLSAYVTFQLTGPGSSVVLNSATFPTVANWDATKLKFSVGIQGGPSGILPTTTSQASVDPTLWPLLVPSASPRLPMVTPFTTHLQDAKNKTLATFDAAVVGSFLTQLHTNNVVQSFIPVTAEQRLADPLIKIASLPAVESPAAATFIQSDRVKMQAVKLPTAKSVELVSRSYRINAVARNLQLVTKAGQGMSTDEEQLVMAHRFFSPDQVVNPPIPVPQFPDIDFHQAMAMLGQHPPLMRVVGVVVDLEIPLAGIPANGQIYLNVTGFPSAPTWQFPRTVYELGADYFRPSAKPVDSDYLHGFLNMSPSQISVGNLDLGGGVLKTTSYANKLFEENAALLTKLNARAIVDAKLVQPNAAPAMKVATSRTSSQPVTTNPPSPRTSGISAYRVNRAPLYAVVRADALKAVSALLSAAPASPAGPAGVGPFYAEDLLKGWRPDFLHLNKQGSQWLSVNQRTNYYLIGNKQVGPFNDESQVSVALTCAQSDPTTQFLHESLFSWNGWSIAVPRPGQPLTDASGRSTVQTISDAASAQAYLGSYTFTHSHYPLASIAFCPPGSLPVLRYGDSYSVRARYADLAGNSLPVTSANPTDGVTSQTTTYLRQEPIGPPALFPTVKSPGFGATAYTLVVRKYADGHFDQTDVRQVLPALGDVSRAELHGKLDTPAGVPDKNMYALVQEFDNAAQQIFPAFIPISTTPHLPYLPDPTSEGAAFIPTSDVPLPLQLISFYSGATWPHPNFGTLTLTAGTGASTAGSTGQNLAVTLAPGQQVNFNLTSTTTADFLPDFQFTWALENALAPSNQSILPILQAKSPIAAGKVQFLAKHTPYNLATTSKSMSTLASLLTPIGKIKGVDTGPSPAQLYVQSFLNGRNLAFTPAATVSTVYATQVPEPGLDPGRMVGHRDPNSTKGQFTLLPKVHGWSTEEIEYFFAYLDEVDDLSEPIRTTLTVNRANRAFSLPVPYVDEEPVYTLQGLPLQAYEFHDTKTHTVNVSIIAKTRYMSCFPTSWQGDPTKPFTSAPLKAPNPVVVPSSRRPDAVAIEAILPVFQFSQQTSGNTTYSAKRGNTIRVYLRRPWFSSGNNEQLAVILATDPANETDMSQYTTLIGSDPAFKNPAITKFLNPDSFPNKDGVATAPAIKESNQPVVAALFNPVFDTFHQMWVVDIQINSPTANAYTPFVRLGLARYQAASITGMNVSSITVCDFTQLHGDRVASLQVIQAKRVISVSLTAPAVAQSYIGKNVAVGTLEMKVGADPDTGWTPATDAKGNIIESVIPLNEASAILPIVYHPIDINTTKITTQTLQKRTFTAVAVNATTLASTLVIIPTGPGVFNLPDSSQTYRVVVREYELHTSGSAEPKVLPTPVSAAVSAPTHVAGRLVHVDVIAVP